MPPKQYRAAKRAPHVRYELSDKGRRRTLTSSAITQLLCLCCASVVCDLVGMAALPYMPTLSACVFCAGHASLVFALAWHLVK